MAKKVNGLGKRIKAIKNIPAPSRITKAQYKAALLARTYAKIDERPVKKVDKMVITAYEIHNDI